MLIARAYCFRASRRCETGETAVREKFHRGKFHNAGERLWIKLADFHDR